MKFNIKNVKMYMHLCIWYFNKYCTIKFYNEYEKKQFLKKGSKTTNRYKIKKKGLYA